MLIHVAAIIKFKINVYIPLVQQERCWVWVFPPTSRISLKKRKEMYMTFVFTTYIIVN